MLRTFVAQERSNFGGQTTFFRGGGSSLRAAFDLRGHMAVLNFPSEYYPRLMGGSSSPFSYCYRPPSSVTFNKNSVRGSTSSGGQKQPIFEFEYLDDKVLEELLEAEDDKIKKKRSKD
ncbi:hypothetical protein V6N13_023192 [Hibiscus sabdariffa]